MKKISMMLAAILCCLMTNISFSSCSSDDNDDTNEATSVAKCTYELTLTAGTGAEDQQDVVKTMVTVPNYTGDETKEFLSIYDDMSVKPTVPFTTFPMTKTITIDQSLLDEASLPAKDSYKVGLHYKLTVTTTDVNGNVIDYQLKDMDYSGTVPASNISKLYPQTTTLTFTVDDGGKVRCGR